MSRFIVDVSELSLRANDLLTLIEDISAIARGESNHINNSRNRIDMARDAIDSVNDHLARINREREEMV